RLADPVVGGTLQPHLGLTEAAKRVGKRRPRRVANGHVVEASRARWRGAAACPPGIESNVVVGAACRDERGLVAHALHEVKAEHAAVEVERALDVSNLQVDVPDIDPRVDRSACLPISVRGTLTHARELSLAACADWQSVRRRPSGRIGADGDTAAHTPWLASKSEAETRKAGRASRREIPDKL